LRSELEAQIDPSQVALLDRILASTHRMSNLIADLLALARVSQANLELGPVNFSEMAQAVAAQYLINHPEQKVEVRIEPNLACFCDPNLTRIALENLLGNAFKYSRNHPAAVVEFGRATQPETEQGLFYVRDNGVGFDMAQVEKLFKPFQRLHKPSEFEGSGIGLATVHRIVERHGGRIRARSALGAGTTVFFTLKHTQMAESF
jgi:signal transduction histidine kinase